MILILCEKVITVFNFAPATSDLSKEFNHYIDILVVNEVEVLQYLDYFQKFIKIYLRRIN